MRIHEKQRLERLYERVEALEAEGLTAEAVELLQSLTGLVKAMDARMDHLEAKLDAR